VVHVEREKELDCSVFGEDCTVWYRENGRMFTRGGPIESFEITRCVCGDFFVCDGCFESCDLKRKYGVRECAVCPELLCQECETEECNFCDKQYCPNHGREPSDPESGMVFVCDDCP